MLGETLKVARETAGLTQVQLAERTNLLTSLVEEIEREDFHRIPAPIYGRGFIKLIGEELGIPAERIVELQREFSTIYAEGRVPRPHGVEQQPESTPAPAEGIQAVPFEEANQEPQDKDAEASSSEEVVPPNVQDGVASAAEMPPPETETEEGAVEDGRLMEEEAEPFGEDDTLGDLFSQAEQARREEESRAAGFECVAVETPPRREAGPSWLSRFGKSCASIACCVWRFLKSSFDAMRRGVGCGAAWIWPRRKKLALVAVGVALAALMALGVVFLFSTSASDAQSEAPLAPPEMYVD